MKKLITKIAMITISISSIHVLCKSEIKYRQATADDVEEICMLFDSFSDDDRSKIVVFPPEMRAEIIGSQVVKGKFFVACDTGRSNAIIAFLKLFLLQGEELFATLNEELCIEKSELLEAGIYAISHEQVFDFANKLELLKEIDKPFDEKSRTYIYYGGAYTCPEYRNFRGHKFGIGTQLQKEALAMVSKEVFDHMRDHQSQQLCYVYGQVAANAGNQSMVRIFADFVHEKFDQSSICFYYRAYEACKPEFIIKDNELTAVFSEAGKGQGNILIVDECDPYSVL